MCQGHTKPSCRTDSSSLHWGGHLEKTLGNTRVHHFQGTPDIALQTRGSWTPQEVSNHINWKELKAVHLCLRAFQSSVLHQNIRVQSDNKTTVALINRQGTVHSRLLHSTTHNLLTWCHHKGIWLHAVYLPGTLNVLADRLSRPNQALGLEWSLHPSSLEPMFRHWGKPMIPMFATRPTGSTGTCHGRLVSGLEGKV